MSEPIVWKQLFPNQRNALIAEHVFGRTIIKWKPGRDLLMEREENPRLSESIPAYTESMDAAWPVLQKMAEATHDQAIDFMEKLYDQQPDDTFKYPMKWCKLLFMAKLDPTMICIAALRALGLIIDTVTERTVEEVQVKRAKVDMS